MGIHQLGGWQGHMQQVWYQSSGEGAQSRMKTGQMVVESIDSTFWTLQLWSCLVE